MELDEVEAKPEEDEEYQLQNEEKRRRRRRGKLHLTAAYHVCGSDCNHGLPPQPPEAPRGPVISKSKS